MSSLFCYSCLKRGHHSDIYSACYECGEFYCMTCSDIHLSFKHTKNHNIFKILLPAITLSVNNKENCSADLTDNDYLPYEVPMTGTSKGEEGQSIYEVMDEISPLRQADPNRLKSDRCRNINVKRISDKRTVHITGILGIAGKVVVENDHNIKLKLFDDNGAYLSSTALKDGTWGITRVSDDKFATCGHGNTVYIWNIHSHTVACSDVTYHVDYYADGIMNNGMYFCVLHRGYNVITILDKQGCHLRHITLKKPFGKEIVCGFDIYMDEHSHDIFVPCEGDDGGVLCVSLLGEPLWFTPLSKNLLSITEIRGVLCVSDYSCQCLYLLSKVGKYQRILMEGKDLDDQPKYIYYESQRGKLFVSFSINTKKCHLISLYSVTC